MSEPFWKFFAALVVATTICLGIAWCASACSPALPTPAQQENVAADAVAQQECIDHAEAGVGRAALRDAIDQCRKEVQMKRPMGSPGGVK